MTTALTSQPLITKPRLVVIHPKGIAVYQGRKMLAFSREEYQYSAKEIEEHRTADYSKG